MVRYSFAVVAGVTLVDMAINNNNVAMAQQELEVVEPALGATVVAERSFPVVWTGGDAGARFAVDLHYIGSYSYYLEDACGMFYDHLCLEGELGCVADPKTGAFEAYMPEPINGVSGHGYTVMVTELDVAAGDSQCSPEFYLSSAADAAMIDAWGLGTPSIAVVTPGEHSIATAGEEYTVEFDYDNCWEDTVERFKIDLYEVGGPGDCGTWLTSICDKPDIGCADSEGDYDVEIPQNTPGGMYKIRVGVFADDSLFGCSVAFQIIPSPEDTWAEGLWA